MAAYVTSVCAQRRVPLGLMGLAAVALFGLVACGKLGLGGSDEMGWAKAALERNDRIEVVATDPATSTFTVRMKDTGELRTVRIDQIVASPAGATASAGGLAPAAAGASDSSQATTPAEGATASNTEPAPGQAASEAPAQSAAASSAPSAAANNSAPGNANNAAPNNATASTSPAQSNSMMRQAQANSSVARTGYQPDQAPAAEVPNPNGDVASVTPGGRVLESGPVYAIKRASDKNTGPPASRGARNSSTSAIERRHDPIICQGDRLLHIDNRNLEFDGDAVSAEDGCEIHITNSHIIAKGVGVSARRANVHIDNSQIEGDTASIDASEGAQVYAASSTFKGVSRRLDNSSFHDLGGNVWN